MGANNIRSPFKAKALRLPGQSLDEQIFHLRYDKLLTPWMIALLLVLMAVAEWWRYLMSVPPSPVIYTAAAMGAVVYAVVRFLRVRPRLRALQQGREGERVVGQYLEGLRGQGYRVFHDVVGDGFNVDHVLIGPAGVFSVETKTRSKPAGDARVQFDGIQLAVAGFEPDRDPIVQAKAQASWLRELLGESTGKAFRVRPVVLFPGWFVEQKGTSAREVWVLNPKALRAFIDREPRVLGEEEIRLAAFHLSRFIRYA